MSDPSKIPIEIKITGADKAADEVKKVMETTTVEAAQAAEKAVVKSEEKKQEAIGKTKEEKEAEAELYRKDLEHAEKEWAIHAKAYEEQKKRDEEGKARRRARAEEEKAAQAKQAEADKAFLDSLAKKRAEEEKAHAVKEQQELNRLKEEELKISKQLSEEKRKQQNKQDEALAKSRRAGGLNLPSMPVPGASGGGGGAGGLPAIPALGGMGGGAGGAAGTAGIIAAIGTTADYALGQVSTLMKAAAAADPKFAKEWRSELEQIAWLEHPIDKLFDTMAGGPKKAIEQMANARNMALEAKDAYLDLKEADEERQRTAEKDGVTAKMNDALEAAKRLTEELRLQQRLLDAQEQSARRIADSRDALKIAQIKAGNGTEAEKATQIAQLEAAKKTRDYNAALEGSKEEAGEAAQKVQELKTSLEALEESYVRAGQRALQSRIELEQFAQTHASAPLDRNDPNYALNRDQRALEDRERAKLTRNSKADDADFKGASDTFLKAQKDFNDAEKTLETLMEIQKANQDALFTEFQSSQAQGNIELKTKLQETARKQLEDGKAAFEESAKTSAEDMKQLLESGAQVPTSARMAYARLTELLGNAKPNEEEMAQIVQAVGQLTAVLNGTNGMLLTALRKAQADAIAAQRQVKESIDQLNR